jgi:hypothetical protein
MYRDARSTEHKICLFVVSYILLHFWIFNLMLCLVSEIKSAIQLKTDTWSTTVFSISVVNRFKFILHIPTALVPATEMFVSYFLPTLFNRNATSCNPLLIKHSILGH